MQNIHIPFSISSGEMIWSHRSATTHPALWKYNYVFKDSLKYLETARYSSSHTVYVQSLTDGRIYVMSYSTFDELIRSPNIKPGPIFEGNWTFAKRGNYYGVIPYE